MSVIISWEQLLVPQRLPSGDLIRLTVRQQPPPIVGYRVEFQLASAPRITWEKRIRFFDSHGELAILRTKDNSHLTSIAGFPNDSFRRGIIRVELVKAMAFGTLTGVYELTNVDRWKSSILLFEWLED